MHALWLVFLYFGVIYPLVRFRVAGVKLLLFFIFLYITIFVSYRPFPRRESFSFLVSLYLTLFLLVYQSQRPASSVTTIANFYFWNKKSGPRHPLGNLAKLPIELRRQIYFDVLGGRVIHVVQHSGAYRLARERAAFEDLPRGRTTLELFNRLFHSLYTWIMYPWGGPYIFNGMQGFASENRKERSLAGYLDVDVTSTWEPLSHPFGNAGPLLRTSRAVYSEAFDILYKTNTFEFHRFHSLLGFSQSISRHSWHSIRSMRIDYHSNGHPINLLQRQDDQGSLHQAVEAIQSMRGLQNLIMRFTHPCETEINFGNMLNLSEVARTEPQLFEQLSRIQLPTGKKWKLVVNWPALLKDRTYTSFYIARILSRRSSRTT